MEQKKHRAEVHKSARARTMEEEGMNHRREGTNRLSTKSWSTDCHAMEKMGEYKGCGLESFQQQTSDSFNSMLQI